MYLLTYIFSVIFSITLKIINQLYYLKKLAIDGYKYDNFKIISNKFIILFIPIINIIFALKNENFIKDLKKLSEKELFYKNNIVKLTKVEHEIYLNNQNLLNSLKLNLKNEAKPNMMLLYTKDGIENIIYINQKHELNIILSTEGPISALSKKEQYIQLEEQLNEFNFQV